MKAYCSSKQCCRHLLFINMEGCNHHLHCVPPDICCDVCKHNLLQET